MNDNMEVIADKIMKILHRHHRSDRDGENNRQVDAVNEHRRHYAKVLQFISANKIIQFVLPAFPAKSPNHEKTAGRLPDLGERLALRQLNTICKRIQKCYAPGAEILICSDGRVFSDLVMVSDEDVDAYAQGILEIIHEENLTHLSTFSLDDCYNGLSCQAMRDTITREFGEPIPKLKLKIKNDPTMKSLFNGIHRFICEDQLVHMPNVSKNRVRLYAKNITYHVIQRSNAWSQLLLCRFNHALRLSIHPQPYGSEKIGVMLLQSHDNWATPWHRVVLKYKNKYRLVRRREAEQLSAKPVFNKNGFSHYVASSLYE